jgi:N-acetylglucosaminyldiphosphoundecaprenol N-acetyl-beta-D-mannosaminyltransferase
MEQKYARPVEILGIPVTPLKLDSLLAVFDEICNSKSKREKPFFVVTAYSEFFLQAQKSSLFKKALEKADIIIPDGVSVLEAVDFLESRKSNILVEITRGLIIGLKTLQGKYSDRVTGVELVKLLLEEKKKKIMLIGGWGGVAEKLAKRYDCFFDNGPDIVKNLTEDENTNLIYHISRVKPDILLVSFGRFKQEIWIANNLDKLHCKIVMGVGSAFDEVLGEGKWAKPVPAWVKNSGLKWLWRVTQEPAHIKRAWNAFPLFPLSVLKEKLNKK